jgi:ADP-ribose pyrophosphatase YjhB (NUDIX family)
MIQDMACLVSKVTTLCYIIRNNEEVLLVMKKRDFGQGKWNGPGGKVKENEDLEQAAAREVLEEVGLEIKKPKPLGFIEFIWPKTKKDWNQRCYIYLVKEFSGQLAESDECRPQWFAFDQIPYDQMWPDDHHWYPQMLTGKGIKKRCFFDENGAIIKFEEITD